MGDFLWFWWMQGTGTGGCRLWSQRSGSPSAISCQADGFHQIRVVSVTGSTCSLMCMQKDVFPSWEKLGQSSDDKLGLEEVCFF